MCPLPGSHVLHPRWAEQSAPVAEGFLEDTVALRKPGGIAGAFDANTGGQASTQNAAYWAGSASVQVLPGLEQVREQAGQQVSTLAYRVSVERDAPEPAVGDVLTVTAAGPNSDPLLAGRAMTVRSVETGSAHWTRDLVCTDDLG
jgi:hypothetical protein